MIFTSESSPERKRDGIFRVDGLLPPTALILVCTYTHALALKFYSLCAYIAQYVIYRTCTTQVICPMSGRPNLWPSTWTVYCTWMRWRWVRGSKRWGTLTNPRNLVISLIVSWPVYKRWEFEAFVAFSFFSCRQ